jgi:transcriptional regulator with GAF, ATPase, and Fis domain/tetratricopeptide (TPR) repeat protein/tRNA A-37 threonylcarbamoyl transferase component Bud32
VREIGRGATSAVWLAERDGVEVAVKIGRSAAQRRRFADEAARLAGVGSSRVAPLIDAGVAAEATELPSGMRIDAGAPLIVLGSAPGAPLDPRAERSETAADELALVVARDIGQALRDLHAAGAAHGDVKPENVVVETTAAGRPVRATLVDLGLAVETSEVTPRGGTRRYLAPEAFEGAGDARLRDLYALGLVLAELLAPEIGRAERLEGALLARHDARFSGEAGRLSRALTSAAPAARPSAAWVSSRARGVLGADETRDQGRLRRLAAVRRAYLGVRRDELAGVARFDDVELGVAGPARAWIAEALALARAVAALRGDERKRGRVRVEPLSGHGLLRFLVALVGPAAAAWSHAASRGEAELLDRVVAVTADVEPESLTVVELTATAGGGRRVFAESDAVNLALALERSVVDPALFDEVEARVEARSVSEALGLSLVRALVRRGELGRAVVVALRSNSAEARAEGAEALRRAGDAARAEERARALLAEGVAGAARARAVATAGRIALDRGDASAATELLEREPDSAMVLEVRSLVELAVGRRDAALALADRARALASNDEERARAEALRGNALHGAGDAEGALGAFRSAAEHAARAGAVLEEATYLTGVAAAATVLGELGESARAARRAQLLFEALGRRLEAARATLSVAASHAAAGSVDEAREAALDAVARAKSAGDKRFAAYAHLVLADLYGEPNAEALEHARRARGQLADEGDDALRGAARLLLHDEPELDVARFDALGRAPSTALDARLEWWGARAEVEARRPDPRRGEVVCAELLALASGPVVARGPALAAGARLAARIGDGSVARRLTLAAGDAAREILRRAPAELRGAIASLSWVRVAEASELEGRLSSEQIGDVESLVRALGRRDRLRTLLRQVVDALVLWTGVERGLLLLRAPGDKLKPRAARNLAHSDLTGEQLALSRSLAERALALGEPVIAVDAAGDLPEVHRSVHTLKLRSVLAVPLVAHGEALGVVYLDDRVRRGAFGPAELGWVRLVATIAAVAIADARAQLMLRRAARRAERAEARIAGDLARSQAELDVAERELARATQGRATRFSYDAIVGESEPIRAMLKVVDRVTLAEVPVLVMGESGSGKELVARAIHANGPRGRGPFVSENCGAVPETLLESTLFGHVRGAFTGAVRPRAGLFEIAHDGTLLLDEIAEMSLGMQAKLLRALQDGEIRPVGSESVRRVDVRVIGATHRDLEKLVKEGRFREDLFYRLNVISVRVPSLRERRGDVPILVQHFLRVHAGERRVRLARAAADALAAYAWPGNVRQLENEIRRALVLADEVVQLEHLSPEIQNPQGGEAARADGLNLRRRLDALEADLVRTALRRTDGNQTRAAELLGVSRFGLQKMMKRLAIRIDADDVALG